MKSLFCCPLCASPLEREPARQKFLGQKGLCAVREKPSPSGSITSKIVRSGFSDWTAASPSFILAEPINEL